LKSCNKVAAAAPQIQALQNNAKALLATGQQQLNAAGAQAFPQLQAAQDQLGEAGGKLATVRKSGGPHVAPIWFDLDDDGTILFMTGIRTVKGHAIRRDPRVGLCVDDETPPFSFVVIDGEVTSITENPDEMLPWSTRIAARYMGADKGEAYGRRNAVPGEMLARVTPRTWWPSRRSPTEAGRKVSSFWY